VIPVTESNAADAARSVKATAVVSAGSVRRSTSIQALAVALCKVQREIDDPTKNKKADAGKRVYRYADLVQVLDVVRPALTAHGFAVTQMPCEYEGQPAVTTLLLHESGEWLESVFRLRPVQADPQSVGSALTYARRYALLALCGIAADDDDDAQRASSSPARAAQQQLPKPFDVADLLSRLALTGSREAGLPLYREYDTAARQGLISTDDRAKLDAAFREWGTKYPKPATTATK
jgi:hypothetical protein